jgi:hypothetical protein
MKNMKFIIILLILIMILFSFPRRELFQIIRISSFSLFIIRFKCYRLGNNDSQY